MLITGAMLASAGVSLGTSLLGNFLDYNKNNAMAQEARSATRQRNRQRLQAFQYRQDEYNRRAAALAKKRELDYAAAQRQYQYNAEAVQRAQEAGLTKLSDMSDDIIMKAAARNRGLAQTAGMVLATGKTGKTARRLENLQEAAAGRGTAADSASYGRALGAYAFNQKYIRRQAEIANQTIYDQLQYQDYSPGPAPFFEGFEQMPTNYAGQQFFSSALGSLGNAVMSGLSKAPTPVVNSNRASLAPMPQVPLAPAQAPAQTVTPTAPPPRQPSPQQQVMRAPVSPETWEDPRLLQPGLGQYRLGQQVGY